MYTLLNQSLRQEMKLSIKWFDNSVNYCLMANMRMKYNDILYYKNTSIWHIDEPRLINIYISVPQLLN